MTSVYNSALLKLKLRAERYDRAHIIQTFVDVDPLLALLKTEDHQVLYGRRGTGKTHALEYLAGSVEEAGDISISIDMRTIGSNGGLYADQGLPISQRATRLLVDTLQAIHEQIFNVVVNDEGSFDLSKVGPKLDAFLTSASEVVVNGTVSAEFGREDKSDEALGVSLGFKAGAKGFEFSGGGDSKDQSSVVLTSKRSASGVEYSRVHFGSLHKELKSLCDELGNKRLWILIDEWSEVPLDLQPYLADLIRKSLLPVRMMTVKIAAIEQRTNFNLSNGSGGYIGIEVGADVTANTNLDDFMVFENDQERAKSFFENFLFKHLSPILSDELVKEIATPQELVRRMFTQANAFGEFVRASEGVPRDAINILNHAAQQALDDQISILDIRVAAKKWFANGKEKAVQDANAQKFLRWLIDEVIAHRQARAFLLRSDARYPLVDYLFDSRVLHIVKHGVSGQDKPGVRYDVYSIDYGCYVDLMNTAKAPKGLFDVSAEDGDGGGEFVDVPINDYRSIRRAILDIDKFEALNGAGN